MKSTRQEALDAVSRERDHQDRKWGSPDVHPHEVGGWLLIMQTELQEAIESWCKECSDVNALREICQVAAVAVACMEQYGSVSRL